MRCVKVERIARAHNQMQESIPTHRTNTCRTEGLYGQVCEFRPEYECVSISTRQQRVNAPPEIDFNGDRSEKIKK